MQPWKIQISVWVGAGDTQHNLSLWGGTGANSHLNPCFPLAFLGFSSLFNFLWGPSVEIMEELHLDKNKH